MKQNDRFLFRWYVKARKERVMKRINFIHDSNIAYHGDKKKKVHKMVVWLQSIAKYGWSRVSDIGE
jgi:hypothetical protein